MDWIEDRPIPRSGSGFRRAKTDLSEIPNKPRTSQVACVTYAPEMARILNDFFLRWMEVEWLWKSKGARDFFHRAEDLGEFGGYGVAVEWRCVYNALYLVVIFEQC